MNDEVLGKLLPDERIAGALNGAVFHRGKTLTLHVEPDGEDLALAIAFARALVGSLEKIDQKARERAATDLLVTYNGNWREFQKAGEDGAFVTISNPPLTSSELMARIELESLEVTGNEICSLATNGINGVRHDLSPIRRSAILPHAASLPLREKCA
jgi:hypothetical protein